jgi:hypothetical protein
MARMVICDVTDPYGFARSRLAEDDRRVFRTSLPERLGLYATRRRGRDRREVVALRTIITLHAPELIEVINADQDERSGYWCTECDSQAYPCRTLRNVLLLWSAHPAYRKEWMP